ncbi:MAG: site-2 protease family protein, partial [Gammaproteobacteria bacterium]
WLWEPSFATHYEDGSALLTTDGRAHVLAPFRETLALADDYTGSIAQTWSAHRTRAAGHPGVPLRDRANLAQREAVLVQAMFDAAVARGRLERETAERYRLSWRGALDYLRQYTAGMRRRAAALVKRRAAGQATATPALLGAVDAVVMTPGLVAAKGDTLSFAARIALLGITAAASFAAFAATTGTAFAACLIATLALHEGGHFLMMKRYDYANLKVFFVPFLGAAVSGHHPAASAAQRVAIYLAGPLPGLLLGAVLIAGLAGGWWTASGTGMTLALLLVAINYTNLLPFEPLDGGRIVGLLWFARHPRLRIAMFALGLCALVAMAIASESKAFLVFCALVALGLPHLYRQSRLLDLLRADGVPPGEREAIAALCLRLAVAQPTLPHAQRLAVVKGLLPELRLPLPTRREIAWGSLVYLLVLLAPLAVVLASSPAALLAAVR